MKEEYTPAEADILLVSIPGVDLYAASGGGQGGNQGGIGGIGGGGADPDGWT